MTSMTFEFRDETGADDIPYQERLMTSSPVAEDAQ